MAVALVEPFGLNAHRTVGRLAAVKPHMEHPHGIRRRAVRALADLPVHGVAGFRRVRVGQPGPGEVQMGRIGMDDRRGEPSVAIGCIEIHDAPDADPVDQRGERNAAAGRLQRQRVDGTLAIEDAGLARFPYRDQKGFTLDHL